VRDTFYNDLPPLSVAIERAAQLNAGGMALEASPNPFRSAVHLSAYFKSAGSGAADLGIFDATGKCVLRREMRDGSCVWNAEALPAGVYVARVRRNGVAAEKKLVLIR
jgi:hypothetical protein